MKIVVHPLMVAAALGLVGPAALADDDRDDAVEVTEHAPSVAPSIDVDEQARIERLWREACEALDRE